jgi:hypothetical protein
MSIIEQNYVIDAQADIDYQINLEENDKFDFNLEDCARMLEVCDNYESAVQVRNLMRK